MYTYIIDLLILLSLIFFLLGVRVIVDDDSRRLKFIILSVICLVISTILCFK